MYKNCAMILCLFMLATGMCTIHAKEMELDRKVSGEVLSMTLDEARTKLREEDIQEVSRFRELIQNISSPKRIVSYDVLVNENAVFLDEESTEILCRIVEAEAGNEDEKGRMLVANVVLNRVASREFPNNIHDVIFDTKWGVQFQPVANGTVYHEPTQESVLAAKLVLEGARAAGDSLYFLAPDLTNNHWIMENREFVVTIGCHWFYL